MLGLGSPRKEREPKLTKITLYICGRTPSIRINVPDRGFCSITIIMIIARSTYHAAKMPSGRTVDERVWNKKPQLTNEILACFCSILMTPDQHARHARLLANKNF